MFKYLILALLLCTPVMADPTPEGSLPMEIGTDIQSEEPAVVKLTTLDPPPLIDKLPPMKNMLLYSPKGGDYSYAAMFDVLKWKGLAMTVGYSPKDTVLAGLSYDLFTLKKFGVETPILKEMGLEPFIGYGLGRLDLHDTTDAEEHWYVGFNILNLRFF